MIYLRIVEKTRKNESAPFISIANTAELGITYSNIPKEHEMFDEIVKKEYPDISTDNVRELICGENGTIWFLEEDSDNCKYSYFIMSDTGKTVERLN